MVYLIGANTVLERLDEINWAQLNHAYGSAEDVPDLLRGLASPDQDTRNNAISDLYANIWHQGTVYEATAYAVPFLIELLQAPETQDKPYILQYLYNLASGSSYLDVHRDYDADPAQHNTPEWQAKLVQELEWVRLAREAVRAGMPTYFELLQQGSFEEKTASAFLISGFLAEDSTLNAPLHSALYYETEPLVRAGIAFALSYGKDFDDSLQETLYAQLSDQEPIVRLAAAVALAQQHGPQTPETVREVLFAAFDQPDAVLEPYERLQYDNGSALVQAMKGCMALQDPDSSRLTQALIGALGLVDADNALTLSTSLLTLNFPSFSPDQNPAPLRAHQLNVFQRQVIQALLAHDAVWEYDSNTGMLLEMFALPFARAKLAELLNNS
jgi:HEAT repeat protein